MNQILESISVFFDNLSDNFCSIFSSYRYQSVSKMNTDTENNIHDIHCATVTNILNNDNTEHTVNNVIDHTIIKLIKTFYNFDENENENIINNVGNHNVGNDNAGNDNICNKTEILNHDCNTSELLWYDDCNTPELLWYDD
jgi:hypothetical protein